MPSEMKKFQRDLLESVRQMKRGEAARVTQVQLPAAAEARAQVGLSQQDFAHLLGVSARTLQDWEQGRREHQWCGQNVAAGCCRASRGTSRTPPVMPAGRSSRRPSASLCPRLSFVRTPS